MSYYEEKIHTLLGKPVPSIHNVYSEEDELLYHEIVFLCPVFDFCENRKNSVCGFMDEEKKICLSRGACKASIEALKEWCDEWLKNYGGKK